MTEFSVTATPKFFKRNLPAEEQMEIRTQPSAAGESVFLFVRDLADDTAYPSRIRITLTEAQARTLASALIEDADEAKRRARKAGIA